MHMCAREEETWQVAGRRRRRVSKPGGDYKPRQQQHSTKVAVQTSKHRNGSADRRRKPSKHHSSGGYSYSESSSGKPAEATVEERVQEELRKLGKLKVLLRGTTLWKRLVEGLASIFPQLGLTVPLMPLQDAIDITAGVVDTTTVGVPLSASKDGEACCMLRQEENRQYDEQREACSPTANGRTLDNGGQAAGADRTDQRGKAEECLQEREDSGAAPAAVWDQSLHAGEGGLHSSSACEAGEDTSTKGGAGGGGACALRELVCYGIGNFSESHSSRYQLALALCLRDLLFPTTSTSSTVNARNSSNSSGSGEQVQASQPGEREESASTTTTTTAMATSTLNASIDGQLRGDAAAAAAAAAATVTAFSCEKGCELSHELQTRPCTTRNGLQPTSSSVQQSAMLVFDPVMGDAERAILAALGCGVLNENEEGKRCCCRGEGEEDRSRERRTPTLFFMPHCPQRLYSNVLWANWSSPALGSMVILGNKLSTYVDREVSGQALADPANAILRAAPLLQELQLHPYQAKDKGRWREDVERLPRAELAFNDLTLSYSCPEARGSAEGIDALLNRPLEFHEETDGELVTGRATAVRGT